MVLGNFWNGVQIVQLNSDGTVKGMTTNTVEYNFVAKGPSTFETIDDRHARGGAIGSASVHYNPLTNFYYLFVTWKPQVDGK